MSAAAVLDKLWSAGLCGTEGYGMLSVDCQYRFRIPGFVRHFYEPGLLEIENPFINFSGREVSLQLCCRGRWWHVAA